MSQPNNFATLNLLSTYDPKSISAHVVPEPVNTAKPSQLMTKILRNVALADLVENHDTV